MIKLHVGIIIIIIIIIIILILTLQPRIVKLRRG